ncbi:hypothetical protein KC573_02545, partial [candidate division WWE3 bacterium]|nr:hypothetical protein [candidate division WWE3 bacterium]
MDRLPHCLASIFVSARSNYLPLGRPFGYGIRPITMTDENIFYHQAVMPEETIESLQVRPG